MDYYENARKDAAELGEALRNFGKAICKVVETTCVPFIKALAELFDNLEPYQKQEILHPRKKPRGTIRRRRQGRI